MVAIKLMLSSVALCLVVFLCVLESSNSRSVDPLGLDEFGPAGLKAKRRFDSSCKGFYDRGIFSQLDQVCEECYNLYRKPHVATECRRDCYTSVVFESCLKDLVMHDSINEYKEMALMVAGKK